MWTARARAQVLEGVERAARAAAEGAWAVGFLAYEAAPAFDPTLATHAGGDLPFAGWAIFDPQQTSDVTAALEAALASTAHARERRPLVWQPLVPRAAHRQAIQAIKAAIARGDSYQTNLTFPLEASFEGDPWPLFLSLCRAQRPPYGAFFDFGRFAFCSASPELFFTRTGRRLATRPMKGTAGRGNDLAQDRAAVERLCSSEKERAENIMIVDMMRNDLGRIAEPGSVRVTRLLRVESYPTVHQLTSSIEAESDAPLVEVLRALFPCASITGAPKVATMDLIRRLEPHARGVYTGALGVLQPGGDARFSVAIRTVTVDRQQRTARFGTGGGIVWDSDADPEYQECRTKALILTTPQPTFGLLETLLWRPAGGYLLLERHLDRLRASAERLARPLDTAAIMQALERAAQRFGRARQRVRLTVDHQGRPRVEAWPLGAVSRARWRVDLDDRPVSSHDLFLFHKTTWRLRYNQALARRRDLDDVLLFNQRGELTESCRANLVLRFGQRFVTPPVACGLIAGTCRAALLDRGRLEEAVLKPTDLARADSVYLINALRGIVEVILTGRAATNLPEAESVRQSA